MGKTTNFGVKTKVYRGKNGFTSTFTQIKVNQSSKWVKTGGSASSWARKPRKKT